MVKKGEKRPELVGKYSGQSNPFYGKKHTCETRQKMLAAWTEKRRITIRLSQRGENNSNWKGNDVSYAGLHKYVKTNKEKPSLCQICNEKKPYDIATKSGRYLRDLDDWLWLCRSCHTKYDIRNGMRQNNLLLLQRVHKSPLGTNQ